MNFLYTAPGHKGRLVLGYLGGSQVMCMNGRLHLYEGYTAQEVSWKTVYMSILRYKSLFWLILGLFLFRTL